MLFEAIKLALRSVRRNVLRSILTLLGIMIGVASVIALVTIGNGATAKVTNDIASLGSNILIIRPGRSEAGPPGQETRRELKEFDLDAIKTSADMLRAITPIVETRANVVYDGYGISAKIVGTDENYFTVQNWTLAFGTALNSSDVNAASGNCVIGQTILKDLFLGKNPVGQTFRVKNMPCVIIGVLNAKGNSTFGEDQDNIVIMPLRSFQRRIIANNRIGSFMASVKNVSDITSATDQIKATLRETRHIGPQDADDFTVFDLSQLASTFTSTTVVLTGLLGMVAAVSLLVGGIGIMNIMLVSVTERTREIGIRIAVGALAGQVLTQFLVEAIVLCLLGGLLGIMLGLGLAGLAAYFLSIPFAPSLTLIIFAFGFSGFIGLVFGYFPARSAARLNPIDALRHE